MRPPSHASWRSFCSGRSISAIEPRQSHDVARRKLALNNHGYGRGMLFLMAMTTWMPMMLKVMTMAWR